jgi:hypothetical protein
MVLGITTNVIYDKDNVSSLFRDRKDTENFFEALSKIQITKSNLETFAWFYSLAFTKLDPSVQDKLSYSYANLLEHFFIQGADSKSTFKEIILSLRGYISDVNLSKRRLDFLLENNYIEKMKPFLALGMDELD